MRLRKRRHSQGASASETPLPAANSTIASAPSAGCVGQAGQHQGRIQQAAGQQHPQRTAGQHAQGRADAWRTRAASAGRRVRPRRLPPQRQQRQAPGQHDHMQQHPHRAQRRELRAGEGQALRGRGHQRAGRRIARDAARMKGQRPPTGAGRLATPPAGARTSRITPAHAAPHIATQCGPPASPISSAVTRACAAASDDAREARAVAVGLQVAVEHHRDRAHEVPARRRDLRSRGRLSRTRPCAASGPQLLPARPRSSSRKSIRCASSIDSNVDLALAHQRHDHGAPQQVVARQRQAAHHRQAALVAARRSTRAASSRSGCRWRRCGRSPTRRGRSGRSRAACCSPGSCGAAGPAAWRPRARRRAARSGPCRCRRSPRARKPAIALRQHARPVARPRGSSAACDAPLRLEALRQVRVGVERDAVGPQRADLRQRARRRTAGVCRGRP